MERVTMVSGPFSRTFNHIRRHAMFNRLPLSRHRNGASIGATGIALMVGGGLLFSLLAGASTAEAQTSIRLLPQVGAYSPLAELGEIRDNGETVIGAGRRSSTLAWGLGLEAGPGQEGTSYRLHVGYGTNSEIPVWGLECEGCSARSTLLTANAAAVLRPIPRLVLVQPYFVLGAGVKRYDFETRDMEGERWRDLFRDQTRPAGQLGIGAEVSLIGLRTQWELNGFISRFQEGSNGNGPDSSNGDSSLQTDLFFTLSIPLGG